MTQALKDADLQRYYDEVLSMTASSGWKFLLEDAERMENEYSDVRNVASEPALWFRRGQLDVLAWLKSRRDAVETAYDMLLAEEAS